jgi:predicted nucleotidyltransferase
VAEPDFDELCSSMKRAAATLRDHGIPFLLAGGLAAWARGGAPREHDVDFAIRPDDVENAAAALTKAGMAIEWPPEGWLIKAIDGEVTVDLIFQPVGCSVDDAMLARADDMEVQAVTMPVMAAEDILVTKLLAMRETYLEFTGVLQVARALREQVDWEAVWERTKDSVFARAFFTLAEGLDIAPAREPA